LRARRGAPVGKGRAHLRARRGAPLGKGRAHLRARRAIPTFTLMTAIDTLLTRASVSDLVDPAPEGPELDLILQAGLRAPDHGKLRPWRFVLIRGAARAAWAETIVAAL